MDPLYRLSGNHSDYGMAYCEPLFLIHPGTSPFESRLHQQIPEVLQRILVTVFGVDAFAAGKQSAAAGPCNANLTPGFEMHFDARQPSIIKCPMPPITH